jgi:hypothetical protein
MRLLFFHIFCLFIPTFLGAQEVWALFAARDYHQMQNGPAKLTKVRDLEHKGWIQTDTFMAMDRRLEYHDIELSPFVDETGESVFLVPEVSPEFPGGQESLRDYFHNLLHDLLVKPGEVTHNTLYIRYSVQKDGRIVDVAPAQPFPEWVPASTKQRCLEAVRDMPAWSPGMYRDRPVKVCMMETFSLGE